MSDLFSAAQVENLLSRLPNGIPHLCVIADADFLDLAQAIATMVPTCTIVRIETFAQGAPLPSAGFTILLADPTSYLQHRLYEKMDFTLGEPRLPGRDSRVFLFPKESLLRILSCPSQQDHALRDRLLSALRPHARYRITAPSGTDLTFTARTWIPLDFEVCTAPIETSVQGRIVVDGALFYRSVGDTLTFYITDGRIKDIEAHGEKASALREEYLRMTASAFRDPVNLQLAEIGIGFCHGASISDCFMEAETAANTCHFCFGNNLCYGGANASDFHGASLLIRDPEFTLLD